jgi:RNA-binding protein Musashi
MLEEETNDNNMGESQNEEEEETVPKEEEQLESKAEGEAQTTLIVHTSPKHVSPAKSPVRSPAKNTPALEPHAHTSEAPRVQESHNEQHTSKAATHDAAPKLIDGGHNEEFKLFIGGLSWDTTEEDVVGAFAQYGRPSHVNIVKDRMTNRSRGFGFISFLDRESFDKARLSPSTICKNRKVTVSVKVNKDEVPEVRGHREPPPSTKAFVGGLSMDMTKESLHAFFSNHGTVEEIQIIKKPEKERATFAFVTFSKAEDAHRVSLMGNVEIAGESVSCKSAEPKGNRMSNNFNAFGNRGNSFSGGFDR